MEAHGQHARAMLGERGRSPYEDRVGRRRIPAVLDSQVELWDRASVPAETLILTACTCP